MPDPTPAEPKPLLGPPEESFDEKYNKRLEAPLATVGSVLIHVLIGAVLVYLLAVLMGKGEDRGAVNVRPMEVVGMDDFGDGSAGSGGVADPLATAPGDPIKAAEAALPDPSKLPEIREEIRKAVKLIDPSGNLPVSDANAVAYASLDEKIRNNLLGARQGSGDQPGSGSDASKGGGPGGTGANSTLARNLRWTLRFKVTSGQDYLDQLRAMGATVLVPVPGSDKCLLIADLSKPKDRQLVAPNELGRYAGLIQFHDARRDAVGGVAATLGLDFAPKSFCAVFSKAQEQDWKTKETSYRNRIPEDIEMTVFRVIVRGGAYEVVVEEQRPKKR